MPFLEDSGIESEDKPSFIAEELETSLPYSLATNTDCNAGHMADLEVAFRGPCDSLQQSTSSSSFKSRDLSSSSSLNQNGQQNNSSSDIEDAATVRPANTCRILQRKLELKVERAKRNYSQYQEDSKRKSQSSTLIPISRLTIPGDVENKPLVDYKSESDDCEEISFFPAQLHKNKSKKQAELTDTFSIQEMTIDDSDLESNDSQNLELLTPRFKRGFLDYLSTCFCFPRQS